MLTRTSRLLLAAAALLLMALYLTPLWRIELYAPQYPEGLGMLIRLGTIEGVKEHDLGNINALNKYIGMRAIDPAGIPEMRLMPWLVGGLVALGLAAAGTARRSLGITWVATLAALGAGGMVDFWWWGYQYGHSLDPNAIIVVPGMTYQPPLIGSKQLLNFTAHSWPALGAMVALVAFGLGCLAVFRSRAVTPRAQPAGRVSVGAVA